MSEKRSPQDVLESIERKLADTHNTLRDLANITMFTAFVSALQILAMGFAVLLWWKSNQP